jgi:hypothetical protein
MPLHFTEYIKTLTIFSVFTTKMSNIILTPQYLFSGRRLYS